MVFATVHLKTTPLGPDDFVDQPSGRMLACRATVASPDGLARITLFMATDGDRSPSTLDSLPPLMVAEPAGTIGALVRETAEGRATVEVNREDEPNSRSVAAAVAVMRASWGWDESPAIIVTVNSAALTIAPQFTSDGWTAVEIPSPAA